MNPHLTALLAFIKYSSLHKVDLDEVDSITINLKSGSSIHIGKKPCADLLNQLNDTVPNWRELIDP